MIKELLVYFSTAAQVLLVINFLLWLWCFRKLPIALKRLGPIIILMLSVEFFATFLTKRGIPNLFLLHIFTLLEFFAWSFFYQYLFRKHLTFQKVFPWLLGIIGSLIIANTLLFEPLNGFNSNAKSLVQLLLIAASLFYFFDAFGKVDLSLPIPQSLAVLNFAALFYYSGSLFIFMFSKLLINNQVADSRQYGFWMINALLYVVFLILILISLWIAAFRKTKSFSSSRSVSL